MSESVAKKRPFSETVIVCEKCNITFSKRYNLYAHQRRHHPEDEVKVSMKSNKLCGMCSETFLTISHFHEHLQNRHNVILNFQTKTFYSETDFLEWKMKIEKESKSSFTLRSSVKSKEFNETRSYFICHRSGIPNLKENRVRHLKSAGSIKSGSTCPAILNVSTQTVDDISEIKVKYQSVHVGHDLEADKLRLSNEERTSLASALNVGIPMSKILDQTREAYSPTKRIITRKDLHNICRDFNIYKKFKPVPLQLLEPQDPSEDHLIIDLDPHKERKKCEKDVVSVLHRNTNVETEKNIVMNELQELQGRMQSINSMEVLQHVRNQINAINAYLDTSVSSASNPKLRPAKESCTKRACKPTEKLLHKKRGGQKKKS